MITVSDLHITRDVDGLRTGVTTVVLSIRMPDAVFANEAFLNAGFPEAFEQFIINLLPALPRESQEKILAGAAALRLNR